MSDRTATWILTLALLLPAAAQAEFPYPRCENSKHCNCALPDATPDCSDDPYDYGSYLFLDADSPLPNDYAFDPNNPESGSGWKYQGLIEGGPADGVVSGLNLLEAWQTTTGRPDVVVAVLDSGIIWTAGDVSRKVALRLSELPMPADANPPQPCTGVGYDCNGDGAVSVEDFDGITCQGLGGAVQVSAALGGDGGLLDGQDLIIACSDGIDGYGNDGDANGFVDDIAGWDFQDDDNDPFDDTFYGHGTGEAEDQAGEANNGGGFPGVAPNELYLPLKVGDSFVAIGTDFAQAMVYAADWPVDVVSEALGTISVDPTGQEAIDYAYHKGIPLIASAADEQAQHHNYPANYDHTVWVNSIRHGDGTLVGNHTSFPTNKGFDILNGCTNHGARAWAAIPSTACSSEATGRSGGIAALIVSHGKNLMDAGELDAHPDTGTPFSAEEVRQIFRWMAEDIDHSADLNLNFTGLANLLITLYVAPPGFPFTFETQHFPAGAGWDQYTGYGRPNVGKLAELAADTIPPEADLTGSLRWFQIVDPAETAEVGIVGTAKAVRDTGFTYTVEVGCGVEPASYTELNSQFSVVPLEQETLANWNTAVTAAACPFDPTHPVAGPDDHTVTIRLTVEDTQGNVGQDRRVVALHSDSTLAYPPKYLGASGESSPALADVNRDGVLDILYGTAAGEVHALNGATGDNLPGFPALTDPIAVHASDPSSGFGSGAVGIPRESIGGAVAADDLDGDGKIEVVAAGVEGKVYAWDDHGNLRPGFPVSSNPLFSLPEDRNRLNDSDPGFFSAPTLANLDGPGGNPDLEIVSGALDGHLYAWHADGNGVAGFPVRLADTTRVSVDPVTGRSEATTGGVKNRARKIVGSPGVGDITGDGWPEIIIGTTEEYEEDLGGDPQWDAPSDLWAGLQDALGGELDLDVSGRIYAVHHDGSLVDGWPVVVPMLISQLLPNVATGVSGSMALAEIDGNPGSEVVVYAFAGPAFVYAGSGTSILPDFNGHQQPLAIDFPDTAPGRTGPGFPAVPATAGSPDAPFFAALGSGAFGDIDDDGLPEFVAACVGLRRLLDVLVPGRQFPGDHSICAWNPEDGSLVPAFPQPMDDMQFISSPALADVDGDGVADVLNGSGTYLGRAYSIQPDDSGAQPAGWPKLTMGWMIPSLTPGDVDGDGLIEVVGGTREGYLFVWNTPAPSQAAAIPWQGFGHDRRNTQNYDSGVSPLAEAQDPLAALLWTLESIDRDLPPAQDLVGCYPRVALPRAIEATEAALDGADLQRTFFKLLRWTLSCRRAAVSLEPLHDRFVDGLHQAAVAQIGLVECDPNDGSCMRCRARAQGALSRGEARLAAGRDFAAVAGFEAALAQARRCEP